MERKELLVALLIGVLLITTAMQTVALASLSSGQITGKTVSVSSSQSGPAPSGNTGSNLAELPSMVGGC